MKIGRRFLGGVRDGRIEIGSSLCGKETIVFGYGSVMDNLCSS